MNKMQFKLIELSTKKNIWNMSLRAIGSETGITNAATVKYHLEQLKAKGLLKKPATPNVLSSLRERVLKAQENLVSIPILGAANCGIASLMADEMLEGYLKISPQLLPIINYDNLFALRAEGDSMNLANIYGERIEEGDYLVIDANRTNPDNGDYILSIIDGCANIKKMIRDYQNDKIALISESTKNYPPIYIHSSDNYLINGTVISVAKKPKVVS
jgi:SOS-response transcriptional repressor LexA